MSLPKTIRLPFGYVVKIKLVKQHKMLKSAYGWWDAEAQTIYLSAALKPAHQAYILTHELLHALTDYQHWCLQEGHAHPEVLLRF